MNKKIGIFLFVVATTIAFVGYVWGARVTKKTSGQIVVEFREVDTNKVNRDKALEGRPTYGYKLMFLYSIREKSKPAIEFLVSERVEITSNPGDIKEVFARDYMTLSRGEPVTYWEIGIVFNRQFSEKIKKLAKVRLGRSPQEDSVALLINGKVVSILTRNYLGELIKTDSNSRGEFVWKNVTYSNTKAQLEKLLKKFGLKVDSFKEMTPQEKTQEQSYLLKKR